LVNAAHALAEPARARRLRQLIIALLALWAVAAVVRLAWALLPSAEAELPADLKIINPVVSQTETATVAAVDLDKMQSWHLFGIAAAEPEVDAAAIAEAELAAQQALGRDGIEEGARKTSLDLKLRGVVASSGDGLGHAIIEYKKKQEVYAVEDKLPVSGRVFLAKVMARQVVLDNGGTYELLELYEESDLERQQNAPPPARTPVRKTPKGIVESPSAAVEVRGGEKATRLAQSYRQRLYQNPQSLADVVQVTAVREDGELLGYRVKPGKEMAQFEQLGFQPGDMVTGVNGIALNDPANTMRLYQAMRSAGEAVFELKRGDQQISLVVNLAEEATDQ
jgi:general secretion pathway protein C